MVGATPPDTSNGNPNQGDGDGNNNKPGKGKTARALALLERAQRDFAAADQAQADGNGAEWVRLTHKARAEVAKALNLLE